MQRLTAWVFNTTSSHQVLSKRARKCEMHIMCSPRSGLMHYSFMRRFLGLKWLYIMYPNLKANRPVTCDQPSTYF